MEGFLDLRIPCWQRRLITRGLAEMTRLGVALDEEMVARYRVD